MGTFLNNNLKKYREMHNFNQTQIAEMIGVDTSQVSRYESGESLPPMDKMVRLSNLYHVSMEELVGLERNLNKERPCMDDGTPIINIRNAQVVRRQFFSRVNDTGITIYPDGIKYSTSCIRRWDDTDYIQITVIEEEHLIVVRKSDEDDIDSQRWCKIKDGKRYSRKITGREFAFRIYKMMNWTRGFTHRISGYMGVNADDTGEQLWFFELDEAEAIPMTQKTRAKCGVRDTDIDEKNMEILRKIENDKEKEKEKRRRTIAQGNRPEPMKNYIFYPDKWGQYTFGLPSDKHGTKPKVHI